MKEFRIGNDLVIVWEIFAHRIEIEGDEYREITEAYNLEGKDIKVIAYNGIRKVDLNIKSISGNKIEAMLYGKDQKFVGEYLLTLVENDGKEGMLTVDECKAFKLVSRTCQIQNNNNCSCGCDCDDNLDVSALIQLSSKLSIGVGIIQNGGGSITIDSELSATSENAVQNKVVTNAINEVRGIAEGAKTTAEQASQDVDALEEQVEGISLGGFVWKEQS